MPSLRGDAVDQRLGDRAGDRMADAAVLAGRRLVLEHHVELGAVVLVAVRAAGQVDDLVALDAAGARKHRVRADAGQVVDLEGEDLAVGARRDARLDAVLAGMDVAETNHSSRSATNLTGRCSRIAMATVAKSSG